jgi:2-keto-4-pentenoate hydratase/2-oxohepta-3-ene-1,7-dioic acid hydratase in catechol pathway
MCRRVRHTTSFAGFTILNDVSHREYQFNKLAPDLRQRYGMNWTQGKGLDGSCPIGPWIVLRDELPDPYPLQIRTWVKWRAAPGRKHVEHGSQDSSPCRRNHARDDLLSGRHHRDRYA